MPDNSACKALVDKYKPKWQYGRWIHKYLDEEYILARASRLDLCFS